MKMLLLFLALIVPLAHAGISDSSVMFLTMGNDTMDPVHPGITAYISSIDPALVSYVPCRSHYCLNYTGPEANRESMRTSYAGGAMLGSGTGVPATVSFWFAPGMSPSSGAYLNDFALYMQDGYQTSGMRGAVFWQNFPSNTSNASLYTRNGDRAYEICEFNGFHAAPGEFRFYAIVYNETGANAYVDDLPLGYCPGSYFEFADATIEFGSHGLHALSQVTGYFENIRLFNYSLNRGQIRALINEDSKPSLRGSVPKGKPGDGAPQAEFEEGRPGDRGRDVAKGHAGSDRVPPTLSRAIEIVFYPVNTFWQALMRAMLGK